MENVVPSSLQRLRVSDVIRMAGLHVAALGQEYFRLGAVHHTQRQGVHLSGIVDVPTTRDVSASFAVIAAEKAYASTSVQHYTPEIEVQSLTDWKSICSCSMNAATLCAHAAALLYQWLARPATFSSSASQVSLPPPVSQTSVLASQIVSLSEDEMTLPVAGGEEHAEYSTGEAPLETKHMSPFAPVGDRLIASSVPRTELGPSPLTNLHDILGQMSLSELRNIARVYDLTTNGMSKQQLVDTFLEALRQPEIVRRVAATLEKPQRQLLAALTLAGGSMTDEDLRGLFERFSLGQPGQLQGVLMMLQSKAFLFRTSLNSAPQQRIGLSGSLLDVGWYVPLEVRNALRVTVPITTIDVRHVNERGEVPRVHEGKPYRLLADLLLVARALDGHGLDRILEHDDQENEDATTGAINRAPTTMGAMNVAPTTLAADGSMPLPLPANLPSGTVLTALERSIERSRTFLRFAIRLLRLADILHKDDGGTPYLRMLAQTARLFLGPAHAEIARDLFELWLTQSSYEDLCDLQEDGVRVRCRATALHQPMMRMSEFEAENSGARQELVALLAQVPLKQWISFSAFARFVYRLNPLFLQRRQRLFSLPHWWLEYEEGRPLRPTQINDWLHAEYHYLARLLRGPLHWWGACDIAMTRDGRLVGFRLTPMAGWLFHGLPFDEREDVMRQNALAKLAYVTEQGELLVESTSQAWPVLQLLEEFVEAIGVKEGKLCYRLGPAALSSAISRGKQPMLLLELLRTLLDTTTQHEAQALSSLLAQVEQWIANYGRIRFYTNVAMLEVADTVVMRELNATTTLDEQIVYSIHPTLHILKRPGAERLIDDLKRRGQMPLLHDEDVYGAE